MAVCTFLGDDSRIYDADIDTRVQTAVNQLVSENETVNFLVHLHGGFYDRCLKAILKARACQPQKVVITLILNESKYQEYTADESSNMPYCMFDKIVVPPIVSHSKKYNLADVSSVRLTRWMILNSTHLITGLYETLFETENRFLELARKTPTLKIISLTSLETEQEIKRNVTLLPDRKRQIFQSQIKKQDLQEVAESLGISSKRALQILHDGRRTLHSEMVKYYNRQVRKQENQLKPSCSLFAFGEITYETLYHFECIANKLNGVFGIEKFFIEQRQAHTAFTYVVKRLSGKLPKAFLTGITYDEIPSDGKANYFSPCNAIIQVNKEQGPLVEKLGIIANLIRCIGNFPHMYASSQAAMQHEKPKFRRSASFQVCGA